MSRRRRQFLGQLAAATAVVGVPAIAWGAGVQAQVEVERTSARVGDSIRAVFAVSSARGATPAIELPASVLAAFDVQSPSRSSEQSMNMIGGRISRSHVNRLDCFLVPKKPGKFKISFSVQDGAETVRSNVVEVRIADVAVASERDATGDPTSPNGVAFVWAKTDKVKAYVGQQITYHLDLYHQRSLSRLQMGKHPTTQDFLSVELPETQPVEASVGGVRYMRTPILHRGLFAQRAGKLRIGAAELVVGRRGRLGGTAIDVEVLPLPPEGRPKGFSPNNVGKYEISATVDKTELSPGDPLTLKVEIKGDGNISTLDPGRWPSIDGARRYDPKVETDLAVSDTIGGRQTYSFLLIPERSGTLKIPEHQLDYFNPETGNYEVVRAPAIELEVSGRVNPQAVSTPVEQPGTGVDEEELAGILVADRLAHRAPRERWLNERRWTYGMLSVPTLAIVGAGVGAVYRRFASNEEARMRGRARLRRKLRIQAATDAVVSGDGFHAAVARMLQELAVHRAGPDGVGLPRPELLGLLAQRSVAEADRKKLEQLLDRCDEARFAALCGDQASRQALLDEALELVRSSSLSKGDS